MTRLLPAPARATRVVSAFLVLAAGCRFFPSVPRDRAALIRQVDPAVVARAGSDSGADWLTYGRDYANSRYSPLRQIDTTNVGSLTLRRSWRTGGKKHGSFEASPLVAQGIMYLTPPKPGLAAYDLVRGRELWRYTHKLGGLALCCGLVNRGPALGYGLVFLATIDARLLAFDAISGERRWEAVIDTPAQGYSASMAPLVIDSLVVVGVAGAEFGIRGHLSAYHVATGRLVWRWHAVPSPAEGGWWGRWAATTPSGENLGRDLRREKADSARYPDAWRHGGGSIWTTPAYDPVTGRLFFGVGNPAPPYDGSVRPGDNLYTGSIVALDARTGRLAWYYQALPHDVWDLDAAAPPVLVHDAGRTLVVHAGKTGWVYILDASDGTLVRRSEPFVPQENLFATPTASGIRMSPGSDGGANWSPLSYSPGTGYVYVVGTHKPMRFAIEDDSLRAGDDYLGGTSLPIPGEPQWGTITAVSVATGTIAWQVRTGEPMVGGTVATAGGLVFAGEGSGWFRAYDARTGRKLWEHKAAAGVNAPPISFEVDGEQLVAVAAGGNQNFGFPFGDELLVFGLPGGRNGR
jgi:alcohol dehydrogenase (cytochrome c)